MFKKLQSFSMDAIMMGLMYYGLYLGNEYATNVFWPVMWVFVFLSIFVMFLFTNEKIKDELKKDRKPRKKWENNYSLAYDTSFSLLLAALGFPWSAATWWIVSWLARVCIENVDSEIRGEQV